MKKNSDRLTIDLAKGERSILTAYSDQTGQTKTQILRSYIRGLRNKLTPEAKATLGDVLFELGLSEEEE